MPERMKPYFPSAVLLLLVVYLGVQALTGQRGLLSGHERDSLMVRREAQLAADRQKNLERMMGQAGATGGPQSTGTAAQSSGPTPGYGAKVAARIKPNVVFTDVAPGNPRAEVEVRTSPDGTITSRKLIKSSGNAAWDEAVLRAIDRTNSLPKDTDGRVPSSLVIGLRPLD